MADIVPKENLLVRMQEDIRRALEKPEGERRWGMVIDTRKCVGCHACTLSCVAENKLPDRARSWRQIWTASPCAAPTRCT